MNKEAGSAKTGLFYGWIMVAAGFFIATISWGVYYTYGVFFKPLIAEFGWSRAETSLVLAVHVLTYALLAPFIGYLSDRFGPWKVASVCGGLLGLGYLLAFRVHSLWELCLFYGFIGGAGMSGMYVPCISAIARWFVKRRGVVVGLVVAGVGIGTIIMPPLASHLIAVYGWRSTYIILGVVILVTIVPSALILRRDPQEMGLSAYGAAETSASVGGSAVAERGISLWKALRGWQFWTIFWMYMLVFLSLEVGMIHVVPYATDVGLSAAMAAGIISVMGATSIVGRISMGALSDRIGIRRTLAISFCCQLVMMLFLIWAKSSWSLYLFGVVFGFSYGGWVALFLPLTGEVFGLKYLGTIFGGITVAAGVGSAIGPTAAGYIFDVTDSYTLAFLIGAVVVVLALALNFLPGAGKARISIGGEP